MQPAPTSRLSGDHERLVGLVTLQLLDTWRVWVKRRVEAVTFPDIATQARHISVDFELPPAVLAAVARALGHGSQADTEEGAEDVADVWGPAGPGAYVLVPLTVLRKQGLTRFSLRDESGRALPLLTRDQTGAVATAVLVMFAEGLCNAEAEADALPQELRAELFDIATLPPTDSERIWEMLDRPKPGDSDECTRWRKVLTEDERFMGMALDLARNFLLLTRVRAEPGRRRIIKIAYEHHVLPASAEAGRLRRLRRWVGWGAHAERIETPAVGLGRCFHLEVEAPEGTQVTITRLRTEPRTVPSASDRRSYPDFPEAVSDGKQRVHLHVSVPQHHTGSATVFLRPRASTIVRAATITAALTTALLYFVALRPTAFQANLGAAAALLLIVPGGLSGYVARPREPHVATHMLLGLRILAFSSGLWSFLAAGALVAGRTCPGESAQGCTYWPGTGYAIGAWAACSFLTLLVLARALCNTERPPEQGHVARLATRSLAVAALVVLAAGAVVLAGLVPDWCAALVVLAAAAVAVLAWSPSGSGTDNRPESHTTMQG